MINVRSFRINAVDLLYSFPAYQIELFLKDLLYMILVSKKSAIDKY